MWDKIILSILTALITTYLATFIIRKIAKKLNILDVPGDNKIHKKPMPLLGGIAIFIGISAALALNPDVIMKFLPILIGGAVILIINLIDDIRGLPAKFRFVAELVVAACVVASGAKISFLPAGALGNFAEIIITLIWLLGVTNAFNYLDGIDGLATGSAAICAFYFGIILFRTGQPLLGILALAILAACLGFLPHNFKKAKIFLGDAGSTFVGFMLASIALVGNFAEDSIIKISIPILILIVPIFDMVFTTIMRIKEKKISTISEWLKYRGEDHFHHRLLTMGLHRTGSVLFIYLTSISFGISALLISNQKAIIGVLALLQATLLFVGISVLMVIGKNSNKTLN